MQLKTTDLVLYSKKYSDEEKALRDRFILEYLYDYNAEKAAIRAGVPPERVKEAIELFNSETYVMLTIKKHASKARKLKPTVASKASIISALEREANYYGRGSSHSARVAALSKLANIYALDNGGLATNNDKGEKIENVMLVPFGTDLDEWEAEAQADQYLLKERASE